MTKRAGWGIILSMKILLIYPDVLEKRIHEEDIRVVPIGLYYIGALLLRHGHEVRILNGMSSAKIKEACRRRSPLFNRR